jgi:molybdopterin molybdotransferase
MVPLVKEYTSVEDALGKIMDTIHIRQKLETIAPLEAYGRVLATSIIAEEDVPPFATSHMDGFAVASKGLQKATRPRPVVLKITGVARPGEHHNAALGQGEAFQVATGARLPAGADTVLPAESVEARGQSISVGFVPEPGSYVYDAGEDMRNGELILPKGHVIRAQDVGLLIALGHRKVEVRGEPVISVIATGSELTASERPKAGKIPDSHSPVFLRLCQRLGCDAFDMGIVGDEPRVLSQVLRKAVATSDLVFTLGGTSAGRRDYIVDAVSSLRPEVVVHGIRMDRGRVTGIASVKGTPILMMPGPIQAAMNAFLLLGLPLMETLSERKSSEFEVPCVLGTDWEARRRFSDFRKVVYVRLRKGEQPVAEPLMAETESIKLLADADGYIVVPENVKRMASGSLVMVKFLPGFSFS